MAVTDVLAIQLVKPEKRKQTLLLSTSGPTLNLYLVIFIFLLSTSSYLFPSFKFWCILLFICAPQTAKFRLFAVSKCVALVHRLQATNTYFHHYYAVLCTLMSKTISGKFFMVKTLLWTFCHRAAESFNVPYFRKGISWVQSNQLTGLQKPVVEVLLISNQRGNLG